MKLNVSITNGQFGNNVIYSRFVAFLTHTNLFLMSGLLSFFFCQLLVYYTLAVPKEIRAVGVLWEMQWPNIFIFIPLALVATTLLCLFKRLFFLGLCWVAVVLFGAVDLAFFKALGVHLQTTIFEGSLSDVRSLVSSVRIDLWDVTSVGVAVLGSLFPFVMMKLKRPQVPKMYALVVGCLVLLSCGFLRFSPLGQSSARLADFARHPFLVYVLRSIPKDWTSFLSASPHISRTRLAANFSERRTDTPSAVHENPPSRVWWSHCCQGANLFLVTLESVGARQIFDEEGRINKERMPFLNSLSAHGVIFDAVYPPFPATTRSHIALQTGGHFPGMSLFNGLAQRQPWKTLGQVLTADGYQSALVSAQDLGFEGLLGFYRRAGFGSLFAPDFMKSSVVKPVRTSSWGIDDRVASDAALEWWNARPGRRRFLQFLTHSTHHPYVYPGFSRTVSEPKRYVQSLLFIDQILGQMLSKMDDIENTLVVITGDHGEAFGDLHFANRLHKSFLYEENIRSFVIVIPPKKQQEQSRVLRHEPGMIGQVAPTLLELLKIPFAGFAAHSFFSDDSSQEQIFFFKNSFPTECGARWKDRKIIVGLQSDSCEVYNLLTDPSEQDDLSNEESHLCPIIKRGCQHWLEAHR